MSSFSWTFINTNGSHPASYSMGTNDCFPGGKVTGMWNWPITAIKCRG